MKNTLRKAARVFALLLALLMLFSACSVGAPETGTSGTEDVPPESPAEGSSAQGTEAPEPATSPTITTDPVTGQATATVPDATAARAPEGTSAPETTVPVTAEATEEATTQTPETTVPATRTPVTTAAPTTQAVTTKAPVTTAAPVTTSAIRPPETPTAANLFRTQYDASTADAVDANGKDSQGNVRPLAGYQYTANGFSVLSPVYSTTFLPFTQAATKASYSIQTNNDPTGHALSVSFTVDTFAYQGTAKSDEWFCVSVTDKAVTTPGEPKYQDGLFILLRGTGDGKVQAEPHMDVGGSFECLSQVAGITVPKTGGKEVYTFTLDSVGGSYKIAINGKDLTPSASKKVNGKTFDQMMAGFADKAYLQITAQTRYITGVSANDKIAFTVNKFNNAAVTGSESAAVREGKTNAPIPSLILNGVELKDYTVAVPDVSKYNQPLYTATRFFSKYCGTKVKTAATASATGHKIVLTPNKPDGTRYGEFEIGIYAKDGDICLGCANATSAQQVLYTFIDQYLDTSGAKNITIGTTEEHKNTQGDNWDKANPSILTLQDRIVRGCYKLESILEWDKSKGLYFTYQGDVGYKATIALSRAENGPKNRTTNCVIVGNWVLKDAGFYGAKGESGIYNHKYDGTVGWTTSGQSKDFFAKNAIVTRVWEENTTIAKLEKAGRVLPGDIIGYKDHNQTILPNGYAFDGGRFSGNMAEPKTGGKFNYWVGKNPCPNLRVGYIVRMKDAE